MIIIMADEELLRDAVVEAVTPTNFSLAEQTEDEAHFLATGVAGSVARRRLHDALRTWGSRHRLAVGEWPEHRGNWELPDINVACIHVVGPGGSWRSMRAAS